MIHIKDIRTSGHWPTLLAAFLYFDISFMVWTLLGPLGAQIGGALGMSAQQKGFMVATPILAGAVFRLILGFLVEIWGAKRTGIVAQAVVIGALLTVWSVGLSTFAGTLFLGVFLGIAGASFVVALPQAGSWYPARMQGVVLGLAGAGNVGVVIDSLFAPRLAVACGWQNVFALVAIPCVVVLALYSFMSKDMPRAAAKKSMSDYARLLSQPDALRFLMFYTVSFGGFVGLAGSFVLFFNSEFGLTPVHAGEMGALCTLIGALARPLGGAVADRVGGTRALTILYGVAGGALLGAGIVHSLWLTTSLLFLASGSFGMANGSVFQLMPQRFGKDMGVMTGLVGCAGGVGGFLLASVLGISKGMTGSYTVGFCSFAFLCVIALGVLVSIKHHWRATWGVEISSVRI
jgi:MFS transporter, NNP family, nitrate/nitrite transporter